MATNYPFWQTMGQEAQTAYRIVEQMREAGETIGQASWRLTGHSWDATRLANGLSKISRAYAEVGFKYPEVEAVIAHGTEAVQAAGVTTAGGAGAGIVTRFLQGIGRMIGFGTGTTAATIAGAVVFTVVLGGITWGAANYLGSRAGDQPIQAGPRMSQHASNPVQAPARTGAGPYFIYSLNLSGPNIYVGSKSDIQTPSCNFTDGGLCHDGDPNVQVLATIGGPYDTYDQAVAAYCQMVTNIHSAFGGTKGYINGVDYWLDNAPAC